MLFYSETLSAGGITVSVAWKFFLVIFLFFMVIKKTFSPPTFVIASYLICIKSLVVIGVVAHPIQTIIPVMGWLTLPLIYQVTQTYIFSVRSTTVRKVLFNLSSNRLKNIEMLVLYLLVFLSLSCIPFFLGLNPLIEHKNLASFGVERGIFQGFYQNMHAASGVLSIVSVSLLFFAGNAERLAIKAGLYVLGLIALLAMLQTYVRTGLLMFLVGFVIINYANFKENKARTILVLLLIIGSILIGILMDDTYIARIFDQREQGNTGDYRDIGSGRLYIWEVNLQNLLSQGWGGVFLGLGIGLSKELMYQTIGLSLVSHSGFLDALVQNGIVGLGLFLWYLHSILIYIKAYKTSFYYSLVKAVFSMYLIFQFLQGGNQFIFVLLFALLLILVKYSDKGIYSV